MKKRAPLPARAALVLTAMLCAASATIAACSSSSHAPPGGGGGGGAGGGGGDDGGGGEDASALDGASGDAAAVDGGALGVIPVIEEHSGVCKPNGGTTTTIAGDGGASLLGYSRLGKVGTRRFIADYDDGVLQTFDLAGTNASPLAPLTGIRFGVDSEGATLGAAWVTAQSVSYGRFDPVTGAASGTSVVAGMVPSADAVGFAGSASGSMVAWAVNMYQRITVVGMNSAGTAAGKSFAFGTNTFHTRPSIAVAYDGQNFGVAWSGDPIAGDKNTTGLYFAKVSSTALIGSVVTLAQVPRVLDVLRLVPTPSGFALLVDGSKDGTNYLILLGPDGKISGPAHGLDGPSTVWDLAASGNTLGLAATTYRSDATGLLLTPSFRPLDLTGDPLSDWVCLGPEGTYMAVPVDMALDADPNGNFSVALADPGGKTTLIQFNGLGTTPPQ